MVGKKFTLGTNRGIRTIKAEEWDELVGDNESPFLEHEWLRCMEVSACASIHSGASVAKNTYFEIHMKS